MHSPAPRRGIKAGRPEESGAACVHLWNGPATVSLSAFMNFKSRFFKILSAIVLAALFLGYFAFSTWLYSPTESDFEYDVSALIPRDVDFYAARSDLASAFDGFPRLAVMDAIEQTDAWKVFEDSAQYGDLNREHRIESSLADLETNLAQIPLGMEPQDIFGGGDIAVAGATPLSMNSFKVQMARTAVKRSLLRAVGQLEDALI